MMIFKRTMAYIFDLMAVFFVIAAVSVSPLNPNHKKIVDLENEYTIKYKEFTEYTKEHMEDDDYGDYVANFNLYSTDITYQKTKLCIYEDIYTVILMLLYYVLFAHIFGGETVGKRLFKLKIVDKDEKTPKWWQLLVRSLILYGMPLLIVNSISSYIFNMRTFNYIYVIVSMINMLINFIILVTLFVTKDKRGLHDIVAKTKVIERK